MGLVLGEKKLQEEGRGSEDSTGFQRDACGYPSVASDNGESVVKCLAGDTYLLCSSTGSGFDPPRPSTF